ncbi:MAG: STAS domain-containing protein [Sedimentisphaerales bacterium]|nr:STAS domain-containing protein [Sedimentisphaerales bacterium]
MAEQNTRLEVEYGPQADIVTLTDEKILEDKDIRELEQQMQSVIEQSSIKKIVLDFSRVKFMSSAVLGLLIKISRRVYEQDGNLALCGISPKIYEIFKITRLTKIFDIYKDVDSAIEELTERQ